MATARKLPSGNYRVRIYDKSTGRYKSFTAPTKKEAEKLGLQWATEKRTDHSDIITFLMAANRYIALKSANLSPTTIAGYKTILKNNTLEINDMSIYDLKEDYLQRWINDLSTSKKPKTVKNVYGFVNSVLLYNDIVLNPRKITLPKSKKNYKELPTADVIFSAFKGSDIEIPVLLAAWCGMRMSEILGVKSKDIKDNVLTINRVRVKVDNKLIVKEAAKTYDSNRKIRLPNTIVRLIREKELSPDEFIVNMTQIQLYKRYKKIISSYGYDISFHDLRHLNASVMLMLNIPDKYAMERGGWSNTSTLKSVYQNTFSSERIKVDNMIDTYFEKMYDTQI